jgi:pimeloyl-ACP methyl ester carboxylesterase
MRSRRSSVRTARGLVTAVLAGKHPDVVSKAIISVCIPRHDKAALHRRRLWEAVAQMEDPRIYAHLTVHNGFARQFFERPDADEIIEELVSAMEAASPDAKAYLEGVSSMRQTDVMEFARQIQAPTLVLGGAEDQMTPVEPAGDGIGVKKLSEAIPGSRLELVQNAGHYIVFEQPVEVARLITEFVEG